MYNTLIPFCSGLFTVASSSFLISISSRKEVARVRGKPIYVVDGVSIIPLSSQSAAKDAIDQTNRALKKSASSASASADTDATDDEDDQAGYFSAEETDDEIAATDLKDKPPSMTGSKDQSVVQDVIKNKGQYGRFAEKWFSKKGWSVDQRRMSGIGSNTNLPAQASLPAAAAIEDSEGEEQQKPHSQKRDKVTRTNTTQSTATVAISLLPKFLRTAKMLLGSHSFFFSYDYDLTRRLGSDPPKSADIPLYKVVDPIVSLKHN